MAEIAHLRALVTSEQTTTSSTFSSTTATIAGGLFVGGAKYLIMASGLIGVDDINQLGEIRLVHASTVFDGSLTKIEPHQLASGGFFKNWGGFWVFDQPGTPETITIEFASTDNTTTVRSNVLSIIAIRLDDDLVENTDWWYNINSDLGAPDPIGAETTYATKTLTTVTNDDYLVLGHIQISSPSLSGRHDTYVRVAGTKYTQNSQEGEDSAEFGSYPHYAFYNETSGQSRTFDITASDSADHEYSQIFILKLNDVFAGYAGFHNIGDVAGATSYTELAGVAPVLASTQDVLLLGWASLDAGFSINSRSRIQEAGSDEVTAGTNYQSQQHDAGDEALFCLSDIQNIASGTKDFDFDAQLNTVSGDWQYRNLIVVGLVLADGGGTDYDETGRTVEIVATIASTERIDSNESITVEITAAVASSDSKGFHEPARTVSIVATVTSTSALSSLTFTRDSFVLSRMFSNVTSEAEHAAHPELGGVFIMQFGNLWHTGEDTFSSTETQKVRDSAADAHDNGYMLGLRYMVGYNAPTWPTYDNPLELIIREGDFPGTMPRPDDPEWWRVYTQGVDKWFEILTEPCPQDSGHMILEHFDNQTGSMPSESGTEVNQQVGLKATYDSSGRTLNGAINSSTTTLVLDTTPSWGTGKELLSINNHAEHVLQLSRSGATITLAADGRGWNNYEPISHADGVSVKAAISNTFGPFVMNGKTTSGDYDEGRNNENKWVDTYESLTAASQMLQQAWIKTMEYHIRLYDGVQRSDGSLFDPSIAGGNIFNDNWTYSNAILDYLGPRYGERLVCLVTNFEEDYDTQDGDAFAWQELAFKYGNRQFMQNRGVSGLPDTLAGLDDLIEAWEDSLQWWPLHIAEVQPSRFDTTDLGTTSSFKGYTGRANDEHSNYLLGANRGAGSNATDHFQGRMVPWHKIIDSFKSIDDEVAVTASNTKFDVVTTNDHSMTADIKDGEKAIRFDAVAGLGGGDVIGRLSTSLTDERFATVLDRWWFDDYEGTAAGRINRFRANGGNQFFVRINTSGYLQIYDGTSVLATGTVQVALGQKIDIGIVARAATSAETDTDGQVSVLLWNNPFGNAAPDEIIEAQFDMPENYFDTVDYGSMGRTSANDARTWWLFDAEYSTSGLSRPLVLNAETGRLVAITAEVTSTDRQAMVEDPTVAVVATITSSDSRGNTESISVNGVVTVTSTDRADFLESVVTAILATVTATDRADFLESVAVAILATVTSTDTQPDEATYNETGRTVEIIAIVVIDDQWWSSAVDSGEGLGRAVQQVKIGRSILLSEDGTVESKNPLGRVE